MCSQNELNILLKKLAEIYQAANDFIICRKIIEKNKEKHCKKIK